VPGGYPPYPSHLSEARGAIKSYLDLSRLSSERSENFFVDTKKEACASSFVLGYWLLIFERCEVEVYKLEHVANQGRDL